jgi:hypothetical protein
VGFVGICIRRPIVIQLREGGWVLAEEGWLLIPNCHNPDQTTTKREVYR